MAELKGVQNIGEPDQWSVEIDGQDYQPAEIEGIIRWAHKVMYSPLEDILKERGLTALERLEQFTVEEDLGEGWRLLTAQMSARQSICVGLQVPFLWLMGARDEDPKQTLREKMQALGDRIWEARAKRG